MNPRETTSIRLVPEQAAQLRAIGRMEALAQPVRTLAWLITRYSEKLTTVDVARAVGVTPSSARYWRGQFAKEGMTIFARHVASLGAADEGRARVICVDDLRTGGFNRKRARFVEGVVNQLFDALRDRHRLGEDSRQMLERAAAYYDLGPSAVGFDGDGIFFTVLDPLLQRLPVHEQRLLATIVRYLPEKVGRRSLDDTGLSGAERNHAMHLLALLKMGIAADYSETQQARIRRIDTTPKVFYLAIRGPLPAETAAAVEQSSNLWRKLTGQGGRAYALDAPRLDHPGVDAELYRKRPRSTGMRVDDPLAVAARKVLRYQLIQMLRRESQAFVGEDPEGVHKMRVATRRIRSALVVFEEALGRKARSRFRRRFRRLARTLGVIRDLDVVLIHLEEYRDTLPEGQQRELDLFADDLHTRWLEATIALRELLRSKGYARMVAEFEAFTDPDRIGKARTRWRAREAAPIHIYERLASVSTFEGRLQSASIEELHDLRIDFKRLRYTIEFYQDILVDAPADELVERTKVAQEQLGAIQDAQRACEIADDFLARVGRAGAVPAVLAYRDARGAEMTNRAVEFKNSWHETVGTRLRSLLAESLVEL